MGEAKTVCPLCERKPGTRHKKKCARARLYTIPNAWREMREKLHQPRSYPIANIYDCVMGPIKTKAIPKGTPMRVQL